MWVYSCFEGDNMALAFSQHDLYFGGTRTPEERIGQFSDSTGSYLLEVLQDQASRRAAAVPWFGRHARHLRWIKSFSHKFVQDPHQHIAAYYRWCRRHEPLLTGDEAANRTHYLREWRDYLRKEIPALMDVDEIALEFGRLLLYRNFDASDRAAGRLDELLVERYGFECVAQTWRTKVPALVAIARHQGTVVVDEADSVAVGGTPKAVQDGDQDEGSKAS